MTPWYCLVWCALVVDFDFELCLSFVCILVLTVAFNIVFGFD